MRLIRRRRGYRFHDRKVGELAELARKHDATMYQGGWVTLFNWAAAADQIVAAPTAVNTFTAAQSILGFTPTTFIPANTLKPGMALRIRAAGTYGYTSGTLQIGFGIGSTASAAAGASMAVTAAQTPTAGTVNTWIAEVYANITTASAGYAIGEAVGFTTTTASTKDLMPASTVATFAYTQTQANMIVPYAVWSVSNVLNTLSVYQFTVEALN